MKDLIIFTLLGQLTLVNTDRVAVAIDSTHVLQVHSFIAWFEFIMIQARQNEIEYNNTKYI